MNNAFSLCEKAVSLDTAKSDYQLELANICIKMNRLIDAKRHLNAITRSHPDNYEANVGLLRVSVLENTNVSSEQLTALERLNSSSQMSKV